MKLTDLDELIPNYAMNKQELDSYEKLCKKENAQIKAIMSKFKTLSYEVKGYKASYSVSDRVTMNEEMLLSIFDTASTKEMGIVKTKEYIDYDALENAIYNGLISKDMLLEMDKAKESKEVVTLRVTKIKPKKEEED